MTDSTLRSRVRKRIPPGRRWETGEYGTRTQHGPIPGHDYFDRFPARPVRFDRLRITCGVGTMQIRPPSGGQLRDRRETVRRTRQGGRPDACSGSGASTAKSEERRHRSGNKYIFQHGGFDSDLFSAQSRRARAVGLSSPRSLDDVVLPADHAGAQTRDRPGPKQDRSFNNGVCRRHSTGLGLASPWRGRPARQNDAPRRSPSRSPSAPGVRSAPEFPLGRQRRKTCRGVPGGGREDACSSSTRLMPCRRRFTDGAGYERDPTRS